MPTPFTELLARRRGSETCDRPLFRTADVNPPYAVSGDK